MMTVSNRSSVNDDSLLSQLDIKWSFTKLWISFLYKMSEAHNSMTPSIKKVPCSYHYPCRELSECILEKGTCVCACKKERERKKGGGKR